MNVVVHAPQNGLRHHFYRIATGLHVAIDFLDPLQVYRRRYADQQVDMAGHIDIVSDDAAVQAFIEQQVGVLRQFLPGREGAGFTAVARRALFVMQVQPDIAASAAAVFAEQRLELLEQVRFRAEVADRLSADLFVGFDQPAHFVAIITMEAVALDQRRLDVFETEDVFESLAHSRGSCAGGTGNGDDGMLARHGLPGGRERISKKSAARRWYNENRLRRQRAESGAPKALLQ